MLSAKTNKDKIEELDRLMTQHKDICDHAREVCPEVVQVGSQPAAHPLVPAFDF